MKKKERLSIDLNEEEICQRCEHANVCWIYARVHNEDIRVFAHKTKIPVVETLMARGVMRSDDEYLFGMLAGVHKPSYIPHNESNKYRNRSLRH